MARPRAALVALAICGLLAGGSLLTAGGTTARPHLWLTPSHARTYTACVSSDCGPWSVTLNWTIPAFPGTTGYYTCINETTSATCKSQALAKTSGAGTPTSSPFTFTGSDCGQTNTLGVEAHDASANPGPLWTLSYTAPACPSSAATEDFNGLSTNPSFFPIGVWFEDMADLSAFKSIGINLFYTPSGYSSSNLATLAANGMIVIECSANGNYTGTYTGADGSSNNVFAPFTCPVDSRSDTNAGIVKGWFAEPDEPDTAQETSSSTNGPCIAPSQIKGQTDAITAGDNATPHRSVVIDFNGPGLNSTGRGSFCHYWTFPNYANYMQDATIFAFDAYPVNYGGPLDEDATTTARMHDLFQAAGQDHPVMPSMETNGSSGTPTPTQLEFETWSTIIAGANGITYFCYTSGAATDEGACLNNTKAPGIETQMSADNSLITSLGSVLNSATMSDDTPTASASFTVNTMTKRPGDGYEYLFTDADDPSGGSATFTIPGGGSGSVSVLGESRSVTMTNGSFTDSFGGYGVHVYKIPWSSYSCPSGVRCFYIATGGSDSNNGTSEATPWAHAPGMATFTGTYSHQAGDQFIFKGGDTWGHANFPLTVPGSGTSSNNDLYGVDQSWYDGTAWTQPAFDAQDTTISTTTPTPNAIFTADNKNYITVDNIAFKNWAAKSLNTGAYPECNMISIAGSADQNITINHITVTGWDVDSTGNTTHGDCRLVGAQGSPPYAGESTVENSTFTGSGVTYGRLAYGVANWENNVASGFTGGLYPGVPTGGTGTISGNTFEDCGYMNGAPSWPAGSSSTHGDMVLLQSGGEAHTIYVYDNVFHDTGYSATAGDCETMWLGNPNETDYIWNNVYYNLHGQGEAIKIGALSGQANGSAYIWDNTIAGSSDGNQECITFYPGTQTNVAIQNNLCVNHASLSDGSTVLYTGLNNTGTTAIDHNVLLTDSAMATDVTNGLFSTSPYQWQPTGNPAPTTGQGVSLASNCTGLLATICRDTTFAGQRVPYSRPGTNGWDAGAYQEP